MKPFVLLTFPRTGSTFIRIWLDSHKDIRCHGELFLPHYTANDGFRHHCRSGYPAGRLFHAMYSNMSLRKLNLTGMPDRYVDEYLERFGSDPGFPNPWVSYEDNRGLVGDCNKPWAGFKLMYFQLEATPRLAGHIEREQYGVLHLVRRNLLRQYVSLCRMRSRKVSHSTSEVTKVDPVHIDVKKMVRHMDKLQAKVDHYREKYSGYPQYYEFTYEDFFTDPEAIGVGIAQTFGVEVAPMQGAKLKKTSTNELSKEILNAKEVEDALKGTPYGHYLNDYK